jgi:hypothetical protein
MHANEKRIRDKRMIEMETHGTPFNVIEHGVSGDQKKNGLRTFINLISNYMKFDDTHSYNTDDLSRTSIVAPLLSNIK